MHEQIRRPDERLDVNGSDAEPAKDIDILDNRLWPTPTWLDGKPIQGVRGYKEYLRDHLRIRFAELAGEFRAVYGNYRHDSSMDHVTATRAGDLLRQSQHALEGPAPDLLVVSSLLDQIERYMVWLYPQHIADALITRIRTRIARLPEPERGLFRAQIESLEVRPPDDRGYGGRQRSVYDEVISAYNRHELQAQISGGLQIERLKALAFWGGILLVVFLITFPLFAPVTPIAGEPPLIAARAWNTAQEAWLTGVSVALIGAIGAFLSGLLQMRQSRITLPEYEESMRKLQLRPLVGAAFALVLYLFLSWKVLAGVEITNLGSYFLVAFLSGFSERYFLQLMEIKSNDNSEAVQGRTPPAEPPAQPSSTS